MIDEKMRTHEESRLALLEVVSERNKRVAISERELAKWQSELYAAKSAYRELMWGDDPLVVVYISPSGKNRQYHSTQRYSKAIAWAKVYLVEQFGGVPYDQASLPFSHGYHNTKSLNGYLSLEIEPAENYNEDFE